MEEKQRNRALHAANSGARTPERTNRRPSSTGPIESGAPFIKIKSVNSQIHALDTWTFAISVTEPSPVSAPKIRYHVNVRAALILAAIGLTTALGLYILWRYQEERILKIALKQVKAFRKDADEAEKVDDQDQKSHKNELALRHLTHYLEARPDDAEALDIEAKLRLEANDRRGAAAVYAHLIRVEGRNQDSARGQAAPPLGGDRYRDQRRHEE